MGKSMKGAGYPPNFDNDLVKEKPVSTVNIPLEVDTLLRKLGCQVFGSDTLYKDTPAFNYDVVLPDQSIVQIIIINK
jgi:hypothetical protein